MHFVEGAWTQDFIKELTAFPFVPHDDRTDAVVWLLTYYMFHLDGGTHGDTLQAIIGAKGKSPGRGQLTGEFSEIKIGRKRELLTHGEREMFFGSRGSRRTGLSYDTGMD